jgi:hypothetical protein
MSHHITIQLCELLELDSFASGTPFLKITSPSGETKTSGNGSVGKDVSRVSFDKTLADNSLTFESELPTQFAVTLFSKDSSSGQLIQYPGIGTIHVNSDLPGGLLHCPLYEDGDDLLEIGQLVYCCSSNEEKVDSKGSAQDGEEDLLNTTNSLHEAFDLFDEDIRKDFNNEKSPYPQSPSLSAGIPLEESTEPFEELIVEQPAEAVAVEQYDIEETNQHDSKHHQQLAATVPVQSFNHHQQQQQSEELQAQAQPRPFAVTTVPAGPRSGSAPPLGAADEEWQKIAINEESNVISDFIHSDLSKLGQLSSKISVRLSQVVCSSSKHLDTSSATVKLSILPLPGKVTTFRSVAAGESNETETTLVNEQSSTFSFGNKTALLSMGAGDVRSRTFRDGACPRLCFEVSLGGNETYSAFAELYLPFILNEKSGQAFSIPLIACNARDGEDSEYPIRSTLIFELNPSDTVGTGRKSMAVTNGSHQPTAGSSGHGHGNANGNAHAAARGMGTRAGVDARHTEAHTAMSKPKTIDSDMAVDFYLDGIAGQGLEMFKDIADTVTIDAYLTASGRAHSLPLSTCKPRVFSTTCVAIRKSLTLRSINPNFDILQIRFRNGPFPDDELGRVCIPIISLVQPSCAAAHHATGFNTWKPNNSEKVGVFVPSKWRLVASLGHEEAESTAVDPLDLLPSGGGDQGPSSQISRAQNNSSSPSRGPEYLDSDDYDARDSSAMRSTIASGASNTMGATASSWLVSPAATLQRGNNNATNDSSSNNNNNITGAGTAVSAWNSSTAGASVLAKRPVQVKSVSGQLIGSVKGMFMPRSAGLMARTISTAAASSSNQEFQEQLHSLGQLSAIKGVSFSTEIILLPEGLKKKSDSAVPTVLSSGDVDGMVQWDKQFSMFLAFAPQQVRLSIYCSVES